MASSSLVLFAFALVTSGILVSMADNTPEPPPAVLPLDGSGERTDAASTLQLRKALAPYSYSHPLVHYGPQPEEPLEHFTGHRLEEDKDVGFSSKDIAMAFLAYIAVLSILQGSLYTLTSAAAPFARRRGRREVSGLGSGGESQWMPSGVNQGTGLVSRGRRRKRQHHRR